MGRAAVAPRRAPRAVPQLHLDLVFLPARIAALEIVRATVHMAFGAVTPIGPLHDDEEDDDDGQDDDRDDHPASMR